MGYSAPHFVVLLNFKYKKLLVSVFFARLKKLFYKNSFRVRVQVRAIILGE